MHSLLSFRLRSESGWLLLALVIGLGTVIGAEVQEYKSGIVWPEPPVVDPGPVGGPPADAIVLFNGQDLAQWDGGEKWKIEDGYAIARDGGITSKQSFGDCQLHVEFAAPADVRGSGQGRGNSGVYLMGCYELQILDSYGNRTYADGQAGSIYGQNPPQVNPCLKPGEWQTYDLIFHRPRFDAKGKCVKPATITVFYNGVLVQDNHTIWGAVAHKKVAVYRPHPDKAPLSLQDHSYPVRFRNIWIREIPDGDEQP